MQVERTISMPPANFKRLLALVEWHNAMPDEDVGDSFHENVAEIIDSLLPSIPEINGELAQYYFRGNVKACDGRLIVEVCSDIEDAEDFYIELVAE